MDQAKDTPQNLIELLRYLRLENIPEEMHKTYIDNYFENRARKKGIPLKGQFELTPFCNLDCKMCYVHLNKEQMENKQLLDPEQWEMLITLKKNLATTWVLQLFQPLQLTEKKAR